MKKRIGATTFSNSIKDTFPYIESSIIILDNNLSWWRKNYKQLEEELANTSNGVATEPVNIVTRFTIYTGPDEAVESVKLNGPAIEFTFVEKSSKFVRDVKNSLGKTWNGHRLITDDNKLIVMFE